MGVTIDTQFALREDLRNLIKKTAIRQCILAKVANCHWGPEVGISHKTRSRVINSLLRYALVVTGSTFPPDMVRKVNTQIINITAREIGGMSCAARIARLHVAMNAVTLVNLYVTHCGTSSDGRMRAQASYIYDRLLAEIAVYYKTESFALAYVNIAKPIADI